MLKRRVQAAAVRVFAAGLIVMVYAGAAPAQARLWRHEDRVLITSFQNVGALTLDTRRVYAASSNGIEIYDFISRRWDLPITLEDGFPAGEIPLALAFDRGNNSLWMASRSGALHTFDLSFGRWSQRALLGDAAVAVIVVDEEPGSVFARGAAGWQRVHAGSGMTERLSDGQVPPAVQRAYALSGLRQAREDAYFRSASGTMTRDAIGRAWPLTSVAGGEVRGQYWLGTDGNNIAFFDGRFMRTEWLSFGLGAQGVSAMAAHGDTLWFGGDGRSARSGVSRTTQALQQWQSWEPVQGGPAGVVHDILAVTDTTWVAASDGLFRLAGRTWQRITEADGISALPALSVTAAAAGGVWIGTSGGLHIAADDRVRSVAFNGIAVNRTLEHRGSLWVATDRGLWEIVTASPVIAVDHGPLIPGRISDVAPAFGDVFAIAENSLYRISPDGSVTTLSEPGGRLGRMYSMTMSGNELWVAGTGGVAAWDDSARSWRYYSVPADIPMGPVRDVISNGAYVWAATPAGALRLPR